MAKQDLQGIAWFVRHQRNLLPTDPAWLQMDDIDIRLEYHRLMKWDWFQKHKAFPDDDEGIVSNDAFELQDYLMQRGIDISDPDWEEKADWGNPDQWEDF